jgi:glycosyltransferase involved in cell wall biosynthesis
VKNIVFVTWTRHQRPIGVAAAVGGSVFVPLRGRETWPVAIRYVLQAFQTVAHLVRERPDAVLVTDPPFVSGIVLVPLRRALGFTLWCDAHSGAFNDPRWARFERANAWLMRHCDGVIVTNRRLAERVEAAGARPLLLNWGVEEPVERRPERAFVIAPFTYSFDEPVQELLRAARLVPQAKIVLTGRAPEDVRRAAPPNCIFTGWLSREDYEERLRSARGLIALTTREDTMQLSAQEGLQYGLPMVASGTRVLRDFFSAGGVIFADRHDPEQLAAALRELWEDHDQLSHALLVARDEIYDRCRAEVDGLRAALGVEAPHDALQPAGPVRAGQVS